MLLAVCREFGMEDEIVSRGIANCFAGGVGNTGAVCGAVCGATMAIGLHNGRANSLEGAMANLATAAEFRRRFEAEMETIHCRELTGVDMSTMEGVQAFMESDIPQTVCFPAVGIAYCIVVDLLREMEEERAQGADDAAPVEVESARRLEG